ncbi:MAG: hypothetical protein WBF04_20890 [Candidatus Sulfotelmatobacter sp.]
MIRDVLGACALGRKKRLHRFYRVLCLLSASCSVGLLAKAQAPPATGTPSWSAFDKGEVDTINLSNLNINLNVPVMSKSGAVPLTVNLWYNYSLWTPGNNLFPPQGSPYALSGILTGAVNWMFGYGAVGETVLGTIAYDVPCPQGGTTDKYSNYSIKTGDGTLHPVLPTLYADSAGCLAGSGFTAQTIDGTGWTLSISPTGANNSPTAYQSNGMIFSPNGNSAGYFSLADSNSNSITWNSSAETFTDTLGLTAVTMTTAIYPSEKITWNSSGGLCSGGSCSATQTPTTYNLRSVFGCPVADYGNDTTGETLTTSVGFPDGTSLGLQYEQTPGYLNTTPPTSTGRLTQLTLRSGGIVTYAYPGNSGNNYGLNCTWLVPTSLTRQTIDGTTTYSIAWVTSGGSCTTTTPCSTTTVVDPGGNKKVYSFSAGWGAALPVTLALTEVQEYQNVGTISSPSYSGTPTQTFVYCYNNSSPTVSTCPSASVSMPITEADVFSKPGGLTNYARTQTKYDAYGNTTYSAQYDYGASTPTFQTTITHGSAPGTTGTCSAVNTAGTINNKPCDVLKQDGASTPHTLSHSRYAYSSTGNLLTTYIWNGSSWLYNTTVNSYNTKGTVSKSFDLANNETDYTYSSGGYAGCGSGCTSYPFPTTVKNVGAGLSTNYTWSAVSGMMVTTVGPNGATNQKTQFSNSDPFYRLMSITDPLTNVVDYAYPTSSSPDTTGSTFSFNSGSSVNNTTVTNDALGRTVSVQTRQGPSSSNYDTVSTTYSWSSPYFTTTGSIPCTQTVGNPCTTGLTTTTFDVLNRPITVVDGGGGTDTFTYYTSGTNPDVLSVLSPHPTLDGENNKQVQIEYDGLGRPTISCGVLSSGGSSCGEQTSASGIKTSFAYTTASGSYEVSKTRRSQTQRTYTDALGRVYETYTPDAGTWLYYFDGSTTPGCPTGYTGAAGFLTASKDPNGNLICYAYDALNRVKGINANGTTCRHFYYDTTFGTVPSGVTTPTNTLGRIAEASTDNCSGTLQTDEWFSYDNDGNPTDLWESTPNGGRYFHSTATFAGNGAVLSVDLNDPSEYTNTYTLDGEGRWTSLVNSHVPQTQVSSVAYNAASQPTQVNIGSGTDNDAYTYDSTGRMKTYTFTVGSANQGGTLNWNSIGTLAQLAIVDGFHSSGTQTCNFGTSGNMGYDDLNRLVYDDCGSGNWGQTFSYDPYGYNNVTKGVISGRTGTTFNPGYNTTNNQYASGYGATYDSNGNQLYDPSNMNTYTWNAWSKLASVDMSGTGCSTSGECITYDAFGRIVEVDSGTTYTETLYTQAGEGIFRGATKVTGLWPAPGWGIVGDSTVFMHQDWLGNIRLGHNISASSVTFDQALTPYGEIYATTGTPSYGENNFTGDVQSIVSGTSGLWDTPNRELGTVPARWLSPDPAQSGWNPYAYVSNPNSMTDPSGLGFCPVIVSCGGGGGGGLDGSSGSDVWFGGPGSGAGPYAPGAGTGFCGNCFAPSTNFGPGDFSVSLSGGSLCDSDFMPCGSPMPTLGQSISSGLPGIGPGCQTEFGAPCVPIANNIGPGAAVAGAVVCQITEPCGLFEDIALLGALGWLVEQNLKMAKGGKQNIVPSWAEGARPNPGESASDLADRLCKQQYPPDGAGCGTGPGSERSKIQKWARDKFGI